MKLINPLHYPLAMGTGAGVVLLGVLALHLPATPLLVVGGFTAFFVAGLQNRMSQAIPLRVQQQLKQKYSLSSPEPVVLPPSFQKVLTEAEALSGRAATLRQEALERLDGAHQLDLLGTIMYACDRAGELPDRLRPMLERLATEKTVASIPELKQKLAEAEARRGSVKGKAREELERLIATLQVNLNMVEQDLEARDAQLTGLSTAVAEATGVLLSLQTKLQRANLESADEARALKDLSDEFQGVDERLGALIIQ